MYEELIARVNRAQAEFAFELARCEDPYRLAHLLLAHCIKVEDLECEAAKMVIELEELDDN